MALDDFFDTEDGSSGNSSNNTNTANKKKSSNKTENKLEQSPRYYRDSNGKLKQKGPIGFGSHEDYEETVLGELNTEEVNTKFWYQMFTHILGEESYEVGGRYKLKVYKSPERNKIHTYATITCFAVTETQLKRIPREVVMMDTGRFEKQDALELLSERLGYDVSPTDTVFMHHFCKWQGVAKGSMISENLESVNLKDITRLTKAFMYGDQYQYLEPYENSDGITSANKW